MANEAWSLAKPSARVAPLAGHPEGELMRPLVSYISGIAKFLQVMQWGALTRSPMGVTRGDKSTKGLVR